MLPQKLAATDLSGGFFLAVKKVNFGYNRQMQGFFFQMIVGVFSHMSLKRAHQWAAFLGRMVWRLSEKQRRITTVNIKLCYPNKTTQEQQVLAKAALIETVKTFLELGRVWKKHAKNIEALIVNVHGQEALEEAWGEGQGVLLAAPHFGNWEVLNLWLAKYEPFSFLYKPPENPKIEQLLYRYRGQSGANQIIADKKGVRQIIQALKDKHLMAILPDQQPKAGQGVYVDFMGQQAYTMSLFSKIAAKTHVPVVMAVAERLSDGKGFDIHIKRVSDAIYQIDESGVRCMNQAIAEMVAINPAQYQWTYRRFSIQADGSKLYRRPES
ncbi:lysophospholipid acyltransferase family protein [Marinicella rhabdoformis]|uniref:lysophospholipid acyltransferase family protein n=1 Tax=Marinicella rhabdoformis TaxID=2580566 RepID=UPI0012AEC028|nr:lysophospholipid acyltransferase family protein [Marinicella rhabdoformis]